MEFLNKDHEKPPNVHHNHPHFQEADDIPNEFTYFQEYLTPKHECVIKLQLVR